VVVVVVWVVVVVVVVVDDNTSSIANPFCAKISMCCATISSSAAVNSRGTGL
jgi:hypothetical protein